MTGACSPRDTLADTGVADFAERWRQLALRWEAEIADRERFNREHFDTAWDLSGADYASTIGHGTGRTDAPSGPGEFAILPRGDRLLNGIYPSGAYTPVAGLITDLKARGLLDETLVIFSGEFGRTPFVQGTNGRDHNPYGFSLWLAGGGLKNGFIYGQTDEYGYRVVEHAHTVRDLHATVLTLLGLDYRNLTYRFGGRDFRLADVDGHPIRGILA